MQNQPNTNINTIKVVFKSHQESMKKTRSLMEKRGKSHLQKVNQVFRNIALDDIDYVRAKLDFKDEEATVVTESSVVDPFE
jgi:hypothetical protein